MPRAIRHHRSRGGSRHCDALAGRVRICHRKSCPPLSSVLRTSHKRTFSHNVTARTSKTSAAAFGHSTYQLVKLLHEDKKDVKQELKTCSKEIMQLMDQDDTLCRCKASLIGTQSDIKELSPKITTFVNIWRLVSQAT